MQYNIALDLLASRAAQGIDSYFRGKGKEEYYKHVDQIAKEIDSFSKDPRDLDWFGILTKIIWPIEENLKGVIEDVYLQANLLAKDLLVFRELSTERQEELRDVCLEISKQARYHRRGLHRSYLAA
jgi:hypothetical protein